MPDAEGNFFMANVTFVAADSSNKDECGGIVEEEYERGTECQWLFKAPPGYYLIFKLKEYITPNAHEQQTEKKWLPRAINNLTCQDPLPLIEGALTIYGGNNTRSEKIERFCLDIEEPKEVSVLVSESLVTFRGASAARIHMSGEDQHVKKIGFLLEVRTACGGLVLADDKERVMTFNDLEEDVCNITIRKKSESDSGIYVRLDEFVSRGISKHRVAELYFGNSYVDVQIDEGEVQSREAKAPYLVEAAVTHEEFRAKNEIRIAFVKGNSLLATRMAIAYSTTIDKCGGEITAREGYISIPEIEGDFDCVWTIRENPGNGVRASVTDLKVPYSPNCTDSYLEFRKWNASGPLIGRWCEKTTSMFATEEVIWMKFRYVKPTLMDIDSEDDLISPVMRVLFSRLHGGTTNIAVDNPSYNAMSNGRPGSVRVAGFIPPADIYLPFSRLEVSFFAPPRSEFRLTWRSVPKRDANYTETGEGKNATKVYSCGSVLVPTWEWQELSNPKPPGKDIGYENDMHCKWTIERPLMTGLRVKFTELDLEGAPACPFDFVSLLPDRDIAERGGDEFQYGQKYCRPTQANVTLDYSYNKVLYVHFVSDRSRNGRGFKLEFRLTCNSFDYIRQSYGLLDHVLTNPGYPEPQVDEKCMWSIVLGSNRRIGYELIDLDLEKTDQCTHDVLSVVRYFVLALHDLSACDHEVH
ncbi:hypothetical protein GCK32_009173 [Trichostrongylus colubriformis]|uniref:CUB domain-containing protein n=1 Tax=Trichostrongylus colubriformis TaxID=6319 RepID=A0AAN8IJK6_TRICO